MAKIKKTPAPPPSPQHIEAAAKSKEITQLVRLARVFTRIGATGPFDIEIPLFASLHVAGKGYRKGNVPVGTRINTDVVLIGKRDGLLFRLIPVDGLKRNGSEEVEFIEVGWQDIVGSIPSLFLAAAERLDDRGYVTKLNEQISRVITANSAMHPILQAGFAKAQSEEKTDLEDETMTDNPLFGAFG